MATAGGSNGGERWSLTGATALVTRGSKGIGHAIVEELAAFGVRWSEKGLQVNISACDLAVRADQERLMETVKATFDGKLGILVNNAAELFPKPVAPCAVEDFSRCISINLESCFHLRQFAHPLLLNALLEEEASSMSPPSEVFWPTMTSPSMAPPKCRKRRHLFPVPRVLLHSQLHVGSSSYKNVPFTLLWHGLRRA